MNQATAYKAYRSAQIETLNPRDLLVQLFKGMERFLAQAQVAMANQQYEAAHNDCQKVKAILTELLSTLNFEQGGEVAVRLRDLYSFCLKTVIEANLHKDPALLRDVMRVLAPLTEAWRGVPDAEANTTSLVGESRTNILSMRT